MRDETAPGETGWRGSREAWLDTAYESLLEAGVDSVRILPLARKLGLARTSFYWFFKDREELLSALLERWRVTNTGNLVRQAGAYAEGIAEAVLNVFDCWLDPGLFDSRFEHAMRSWALQSPHVAQAIAAADESRIAALTRMFERFGYDPVSADVRARAMYLTQIGYISMKTEEDLALRMKRIPDYVMVFTGLTPERRDLQRFAARHGIRLDQPAAAAAGAAP